MSDPLHRAPDTERMRSPRAILAIVGFSVFVAADDLTVVSTMLRPIIGDLGLVLPDGLDDAAWIVNAYLIAFVAIMPLAGRLSDVVGRRRTFVGAYLLFLAGTTLIPLSVSFDDAFGWFLAGRVLTAVGGGAMVPVALAVVGDVYDEQRRARALGTLGAIETLGWVWGPLYGAMLVRFLSWQWQFWLNIPLAIGGLALTWHALADHDRPATRPRVDWLGATLLTVTLVSLNLALLGGAEIQSVSGLDELSGGGGTDTRLLYPVALAAGAAFVWSQRRTGDPLINPQLFAGRNLLMALAVNFVVGVGLVTAMVDVPLFINAVEIDVERAAVIAGWVLSALTAAMAAASYVGGRLTERTWYRPPALAGVALSTIAYLWMGATWNAESSQVLFAVQLALLGAGFGLTVAPTTSAVVDAAPPAERGAAAGLVMVVRLLGLSVGLSALTAWALHRFNALRGTIELPPIGSDGFDAALLDAQADLTAQAIAETFTAAAVVLAIGVLAALAMRRRTASTEEPVDDRSDDEITDDDISDDDISDTEEHELMERLTVERRRTNSLVGALAIMLVGACVAIFVLIGRVDDARATAERGVDAERIAELEADIERVEAGAALYSSQLTGLQEQLTAAAPELEAGIDEAIGQLRDFGESTIEFPVAIDETIPIDLDVVIERTVEVPIQLTVPIDEEIDTTIQIDTPFGQLPLDITVPVDVDIPIDETISIPINETVPIEQSVPVQLDVPIAIDVGDTELATLSDSIADGLESLRTLLDSLATGATPTANADTDG